MEIIKIIVIIINNNYILNNNNYKFSHAEQVYLKISLLLILYNNYIIVKEKQSTV